MTSTAGSNLADLVSVIQDSDDSLDEHVHVLTEKTFDSFLNDNDFTVVVSDLNKFRVGDKSRLAIMRCLFSSSSTLRGVVTVFA